MSMLRNRACGILTMCFWILLASKRANCKPCSLSTPRHNRRTAASSSSLIETCRITNGFFDYKGESSLMMPSRISTIFFYSTTGLLNKSIHPLILLLKPHDFIISITLAVSSQNDRQSGGYHLVRPHVAWKGRQAPWLEHWPTCTSPSGKIRRPVLTMVSHNLTRKIACCSRRSKLWQILLTRKPYRNSVSKRPKPLHSSCNADHISTQYQWPCRYTHYSWPTCVRGA